MARKNRKTLEAKFKNGKMPSEVAFADLIDSTLNLIDDGFEKTIEDGLKIAQLGDGKLISFYQNMATLSAMWFVGLDKATTNLRIGNKLNPHVLTLKSIDADDQNNNLYYAPKMGVGINKEDPQFELDVAGTIASYARVGRLGEFAVQADGNWYDITEILTGCQAFEVVAGVGGRDADGKFALMHAFALSAYNDKAKNHISYHQAHYGSKCNRLELRWKAGPNEENFEFTLQLRVESSYGENVWIKYHITRLWHDTAMLESEVEPSIMSLSQLNTKKK